MRNLGVIIVVIVLILLGYFYWQNRNSSVTSTTGTESTTTAEDTGTQQSGLSSLKDLLAQGTAQKCNYTFSDDRGSYTGTMLVSGKKFKQEINTKLTGETTEMKVTTISDGENIYMWNTEMGNQGIKMAVSETENSDYSTQNGKIDWENKSYNCQAATVSEADLTPPKDIQFQDLGAQLKQLQQLQGTGGLPTGVSGE